MGIDGKGEICLKRQYSYAVLFIIVVLVFSVFINYTYAKLYKSTNGVDAESLKKLIDEKLTTQHVVNSQVKFYNNIEKKIIDNGNARVIVRVVSEPSIVESDGKRRIAYGIDAINTKQDIAASLGNDFVKDKDLGIINGFSGTITKKGLEILKNSGAQIEIYEDRKYMISKINRLDSPQTQLKTNSQAIPSSIINNLNISTAAIGANYSWNVLNYTGRNITIAVIDTGIDYMHPDLGGCNATSYVQSSSNYTYALQSDHPYNDSFDYTWNITNTSFSKIAIHFVNISLAYPAVGNESDESDRIIIYDSNMKEIAVYHGNVSIDNPDQGSILNDVWTPFSNGNTMYVRLITDSTNVADGFYINGIMNGTTSTTINWTNCTRVIGGWDFVNNDADPMDDNGHGTHVAGIIGANGGVRGVAPDSELYALKVCNAQGSCFSSNIISALDWAVNNSANIASISIGGSYSYLNESNAGKDATSIAVDNAVNSGLIVVVSAGNNYNSSGGVTAIGTINVPAASVGAIAVGSVDDGGTVDQSDDAVPSFSARGPASFGRFDPVFTAPGVNINSTNISVSGIAKYEILSGTSMSAPHVSGAIALMLEQNRNLTPRQVRAILIDSATNINDNPFVQGAGEVNVQNAMTYKTYAYVTGYNTYENLVTNDRWEFIANPIAKDNLANITIFNSNDYNITFSYSIADFLTLEDTTVNLSSTQLHIPASINVTANSNYTFTINISLTNISQMFASTYSSLLVLRGIENNGTANISKNITIPIAVTIPIINYANIMRTAHLSGDGIGGNPSGDVLSYVLYNNRSNSETFTINWTSSSDDLDLYVYNSTGDADIFSASSDTTNESAISTKSDQYKWFRIHAFNFAGSSLDFNIVTTDNTNNPPIITSLTDISGQNSGQNNFNVIAGNNATLLINYSDPENDSVIVSLNDSRYSLVNSSANYSLYSFKTNASVIGNHSILVSLVDSYGGLTTAIVNVSVSRTVNIISYSPSNASIVISTNTLLNFTDTVNSSGQIGYSWYINGTLSSTSQNFTFNASSFNPNSYNISFIATDNITNASVSWNVTIDNSGPAFNVQSLDAIYTNSPVSLNYTATDISQINSCWFVSNSSGVLSGNNTLASCSNTTLYFANGNYSLIVYSNDIFGNIGSSSVQSFMMNDTTPPAISSPLPSGGLSSSLRSVTLRVTTNENATCKYGSNSDDDYSALDNNFVDSTTSHSSIESVTPGEYIIYVRCRDLSHNDDQSSTIIHFTIPSSGGSSSGGNSAGNSASSAGSSAPSNTIAEYKSRFVSANGTINVFGGSSVIPITSFAINLIGTQSDFLIDVSQYNNSLPPSDAASLSVYKKRFAIISIQHDGLDDLNISSVNISFSVDKSWVVDNGLQHSDIVLYRFSGNTWNALETSYVDQDDSHYFYNAVSPGLSDYIIGSIDINPPAPGSDAQENNSDNTQSSGNSSNKNLSAGPLTITDRNNGKNNGLSNSSNSNDSNNSSKLGLFSGSLIRTIAVIVILAGIIGLVIINIPRFKKKHLQDNVQQRNANAPQNSSTNVTNQYSVTTKNPVATRNAQASQSSQISQSPQALQPSQIFPVNRASQVSQAATAMSENIKELQRQYQEVGTKIRQEYLGQVSLMQKSDPNYSQKLQKVHDQYEVKIMLIHQQYQDKILDVQKRMNR